MTVSTLLFDDVGVDQATAFLMGVQRSRMQLKTERETTWEEAT